MGVAKTVENQPKTRKAVTDLATHAESVANAKVPGAAERNALAGPDAQSGCRDAKSSTMKEASPDLTPNPPK